MTFLGLFVAFCAASGASAAPDDDSAPESAERAEWVALFTGKDRGDVDPAARAKTKRTLITPKERPVELSRSWLKTQPQAAGDDDWRCLSEALYFEARGETVKGQFAVAEVILNRVDSKRFPSSACGVINQGTGKKFQCQFTYTCDGHKEVIREPKAFEQVSKVARIALDGRAPNLTEGATHYHTRAVRPSWARVYKKTATIGQHIFYRHTWRTASN